MLSFVKASEMQMNKPHTVANKLERSRLDKLRGEIGISIDKLNSLLPSIVGRQISDFSQLSVGENRHVVLWLKQNQWKLEKDARKELWK